MLLHRIKGIKGTFHVDIKIILGHEDQNVDKQSRVIGVLRIANYIQASSAENDAVKEKMLVLVGF